MIKAGLSRLNLEFEPTFSYFGNHTAIQESILHNFCKEVLRRKFAKVLSFLNKYLGFENFAIFSIFKFSGSRAFQKCIIYQSLRTFWFCTFFAEKLDFSLKIL